MVTTDLTLMWLAQHLALQDVDRRTVRVQMGEDWSQCGHTHDPEIIVPLSPDTWASIKDDFEKARDWVDMQAHVLFAFQWRSAFRGGCE